MTYVAYLVAGTAVRHCPIGHCPAFDCPVIFSSPSHGPRVELTNDRDSKAHHTH